MDITQLAAEIVAHIMAQKSRPYIFGISGGQGAGKSTLCAAVTAQLAARGLRCVTLGLDDFYLPQQARVKLAQEISPLCRTRGVPGTHDVTLLQDALDSLRSAGPRQHTALPAFSKSHDEQLPRPQWTGFTGSPEVILIEGWCVGGLAAERAAMPVTAWEQSHDPDGVWRDWTLAAAAPCASTPAPADGAKNPLIAPDNG